MVIDFNPFYDFPRRVDRLFEELWKPSYLSQRRVAYPLLNISEDDHAIRIRAEIPGLAMEDIELTLTNKSLILRGERKPEQGKYYRQERPTGAFQRVVTLNVPIDRDAVTASLADGVLLITLPKAEEMKPRKIAINPA